MSKGGDTPWSARMALAGARWILGLLVVSMLAGAATIPYVAYHFHRVSPYGVIANLAAMPIVSAWVMPAGIVGLLTMPLGLDGPCWHLMGVGIEWMVEVARSISSFPGALGRMAAFGIGPLLICTLGLVVLCLLETPLRFLGALLIVCAIILMLRAPQPDVLIAPDGGTVAVRGADGRFAVAQSGNDVFALRDWLAADGDSRDPKDPALGNGMRCDAAGCIGKLRDGSLVAIARTIEAFQEDCRRAVLVVSTRDAPFECAAVMVDRQVWRRLGAMSLRRVGGGFEVTAARPAGYDRPWTRAAAQAPPVTESTQQRDATPRADDLEAGD
jgi:competence protein ComEC